MNNLGLPEEKKKYEKEFLEILYKRLKHSGGSLQFQHLSSILQQVPFEIRDAFGTTKSELMKFLKLHPDIFRIDPMGNVKIIDSLVTDATSHDLPSNRKIEERETVVKKIDKGEGFIVKLHPEFGIIAATKPIETKVHFKSQAYCDDKNQLLSDTCLQTGDEVYFNAVHGHDDYDIKFSASKVWQKFNPVENCENESHDSYSNNLNGEGIIIKLSGDVGFISVNGKKKELVFFHKSRVQDIEKVELENFLRVGESVEFFASINKKEASNCKWRAFSVKKISQNNVQSPSNTEIKSIADTKNKLLNEHGKLYLSDGVIVKFGQNFSQIANAEHSKFFLYEAEVSDIAWEFSEGDDVWFDAIKSKSCPSGWRAVNVWVGDKPSYISNKLYSDENTFSEDKSYASSSNISSTSFSQKLKPMPSKHLSEEKLNSFSDDKSYASSNASSRSYSPKSKPMVSEKDSTTREMPTRKKLFDHSNNERDALCDSKHKKNSKFASHQNFSAKNSKNRKDKTAPNKENSFINRNKGNGKKDYKKTTRENSATYKPKQKKSPIEHKSTFQTEKDFGEISANFRGQSYFKDDMSDVSEDSFQDSDFPDILPSKKYLMESKGNNYFSTSENIFSDSDVNEDNKQNEINECQALQNTQISNKKKASITKFKDLDGKIKKIYCKAGFIESSHLQQDINFMCGALYLGGKPVEEEDEIMDLKEIINVGDEIKFNYFEIIDDSGMSHYKVTLAWQGPKPEIREMTPEEFIKEENLSVTIPNEVVPEYSSKDEISKKCVSDALHYEETLEILSNSPNSLSDEEMFNEPKSSNIYLNENLNEPSLAVPDMLDSEITERLTDESDDEKFQESRTSGACLKEILKEEESSLDVQTELLSEKIIQSLKSKGLISADFQVDFSSVLPKITNLIQRHNEGYSRETLHEVFPEHSQITSSVCPYCSEAKFSEKKNTEKHVAVQTIITGGIIAQNEAYSKVLRFAEII